MFNWEESTDHAEDEEKEKDVCNMLCGAVIPVQIIDSGWTVKRNIINYYLLLTNT